MTDAPPAEGIRAEVEGRWRRDVLPLLETFARIPDLSPAFDPGWETAGHLEAAAVLLADWASARALPGATVDVVRLPGLTPTVVVEVPASDPAATGTVLVYGHYDKQPPFDGWTGGRGPWTPVLEGDRLYARGVADDGYALPSALVAIESVIAAGGRHGRCVLIAEGSEESGSPHLPAVLDHLSDRIGVPDVVVALDSGCPTYDRLWITTSLRGFVEGTLTVSVLDHGVHSGAAGGVVPDSFRLARQLLARVEDAATGAFLLPELQTPPPAAARAAAEALADAVAASGDAGVPFPVVDGLELEGGGPADRALRNAWATSLAVVGADGLPPTVTAGNVLRPSTSLKLVFRVSPNADADAALAAVGRALTEDPPSGAAVSWTSAGAAQGWAAAPTSPWVDAALDAASRTCFGRPSARFGEGGSIPFMGWLAARFPAAELLAAGVLGPGSNAHGPDESLHLPTAERVTASMGILMDAHARRPPGEAGAGPG
jgi:acetylornithine deacetylase/succinyl-diaminopimelate desuccinylase-like protein